MKLVVLKPDRTNDDAGRTVSTHWDDQIDAEVRDMSRSAVYIGAAFFAGVWVGMAIGIVIMGVGS